MFQDRKRLVLLLLTLALPRLGCPGDASDGPASIVKVQSTPTCRVIAGGFPSGFGPLPDTSNEAAVIQFRPPAVVGLDLDVEPPALLAATPPPAWPEISAPRCRGLKFDSDSDGRPDPDRSDELGFDCRSPAPGRFGAIRRDLIALATSSYEQILFLDPQNGELEMVALAPPAPGAGFDPDDWPFWPAAGVLPFQTGVSTRACVYGESFLDSLGAPIGTATSCDPGRPGFFTTFTADPVLAGDKLFVATSNLLRSSRAQYAPGTVLVFDLDLMATPPRIGPRDDHAILVTTGYNPTSVTPHTTVMGRELLLVGVSGAIALGTGPDLVRTEAAIDVIDVDRQQIIATIPLGFAGLGFGRAAIDPSGRIALFGAATTRALFGVDLAPLDDPMLGLGPETLPIVLDGMTPGFPDARVFSAANPFELPKRADGPLDSTCATQTSVAIRDDGGLIVAGDFCDGTVSALRLALPSARTTPIDPDRVLLIERLIPAVAPIRATATGEIRAIDSVLIRPGTPGVDFDGPDVHITTGLPSGAVCGLRVDG